MSLNKIINEWKYFSQIAAFQCVNSVNIIFILFIALCLKKFIHVLILTVVIFEVIYSGQRRIFLL